MAGRRSTGAGPLSFSGWCATATGVALVAPNRGRAGYMLSIVSNGYLPRRMLSWILSVIAGAVAAAAGYLPRPDGSTHERALPMSLRFAGVMLVAALALDAPAGCARRAAPFAALDASASWSRGGDASRWNAARDSARGAGADSIALFGDSVRVGEPPREPTDALSRAQPVVERALASGRPLIVITDGELADPEALRALPSGSRVIVAPPAKARDAALVQLEAPHAVVQGDTIDVRIDVSAGARGAAAGRVALLLGDAQVADVALDSMSAWGERSVTARARATVGAGPAMLRAVLHVPGDDEPRNDTLAVPIDVASQASAVFVSSSPDADVRWLVATLRGAVSLPTRAYYRVAPGQWRVEGSLAPIAESDVRKVLRDAPLAVIHGDTALFGPPLTATRGALALLAPPLQRTGEWYATGTPPSPVAASLAGVRWDSLPPLDVALAVPRGDWVALEAQRSPNEAKLPVVVGRQEPRRTIIVAATGFARWRVRAGAPADAFGALWGAIFDWLAQERPDVRAALPAGGVLREGDAITWRRGGGRDSVVRVLLRRRGVAPVARKPEGRVARSDTVVLRFARGSTEAQSPPLPMGVYDVTVPGGPSLLVVNRGTEWVPRRPTVQSGAVGAGAALGDAPLLRQRAWPFVLGVVLLCGEWILRRRAGMR